MMMDFGFQPMVDLTPFLEKLAKNELTLEDILEENSIIDDIKNNYKSQFIDFLTDDKIKKLIDYSTKLPSSDTHNIGYKYPFNATEILCSENTNFQKRFMSEKPFITKDNKEKELREKLNQAKKINKKGFISELFKIINKVKNEENINNIKNEENKENNNNNIDGNDEDYEDSIDEEDIDLDKDENKENKNNKVIYENVDYLLNFLKESDETKDNYVLVGYFFKILSTLINLHSMKIIEYLYDYPKKDEFDVLGLFIKHMNRKSMCNIIHKLLIFEDEFISKFDDKKIILLEKILDELNISNDRNKYECICDLLSLVMNNNIFFNLFMNHQNFLIKIYNILFNSEKNAKKVISILKLLIRINENILQQFEVRYTSNNPENNNEMNPFNVETCYSHDLDKDKSISSHEDNSDILKKFLFLLFDILEQNKFDFLKDFGNCNLEENGDFTATYMGKQKKLGMTKITQIEYLLSLIEIFINSYASKYHENKIETLINLANEKNLFFNIHDIFLMFPFSNIYQILYKKLMEFVLNENSPSCLVNTFFIESTGQKRNLIELYIDKIISDMKFNFDLTKTKCFNPCFSYIISILNKIYKSKNIHVKKIIENNKNISIFNEIMGEEINNIFNQKLLLNDTLGNFGENEQEKPLQTFGPKNFLEIFDENCKIYEIYKNGGNYQELLNEKKERKEKEVKENNEKKDDRTIKKISNLEYIDDLEDEDDDPLFKVEKINLEKDKENFLAILNKPTEEVIKEHNLDNNNNDKNKNNDGDKNVGNSTNENPYKMRYNINDLEDNEDEDEKENDIIEDDKLNDDDLAPNQIENKIYHVDYIKKSENEN